MSCANPNKPATIKHSNNVWFVRNRNHFGVVTHCRMIAITGDKKSKKPTIPNSANNQINVEWITSGCSVPLCWMSMFTPSPAPNSGYCKNRVQPRTYVSQRGASTSIYNPFWRTIWPIFGRNPKKSASSVGKAKFTISIEKRTIKKPNNRRLNSVHDPNNWATNSRTKIIWAVLEAVSKAPHIKMPHKNLLHEPRFMVA